MKRLYLVSAGFIVAALAVLSLAAVVLAESKSRTFTVDLQPLNDSGVSGTAELVLTDDELMVTIHADGLEADKPHPQHIHGFMGRVGNSTCPTAAADADGDGLVSVGEGLPNYGPVLLPLQPFTMAPAGVIEFVETYDDLDSLGPDPNTLQNRSIVIHGLSVNDEYVPSLPVACGQIRPAPARP